MGYKYFCLLSSLVLISTGCGSHAASKITQSLPVSPLKEARVFQKEKLAKGGHLLVVPFTAGEWVEASDELDHVSLMIVKGIADVLGQGGGPFKVLVEQDAQSADLVVKGRILLMEEKAPLRKPWEKKTKIFQLSVEGSILGVEPDEILAKFSQSETRESQQNAFQPLGYDLGVAIGRFLLTNIQ